jgi:hypothetical protein
MRKTSLILFAIAGIVMPIFIGLLHTYVHFTDLVTSEVFDIMQSEVIVMEKEQPAWNSWGMMSFMMGMSFIVIGIINISVLKTAQKYKSRISNIAYMAMIIYLLCVIYVGKTFEADPQFYGGIVDIFMILVSMYFNYKGNAKRS